MNKKELKEELLKLSVEELIDRYEKVFLESCPRIGEDLIIKALVDNKPYKEK